MTRLLEQAIAKAGSLPPADQDAIGQLVLDEIEAEEKWDQRFPNPSDKLRNLADKAWADHEAGQTELLDPDNL